MNVQRLTRYLGGALSGAARPQTSVSATRHAPSSQVDDDIHGLCFIVHWSRPALQKAAYGVTAMTLVTCAAGMSENFVLRCVAAGLMLGLAAIASALARRVRDCMPVLVIDERGLTDRRQSPEPIVWREIKALEPADLQRTKVLEIHTRRNASSATCRTWWNRLGASLQRGYGLPAVTINLLLLDTSAADVVGAMSYFHPGVVPPEMRKAGSHFANAGGKGAPTMVPH